MFERALSFPKSLCALGLVAGFLASARPAPAQQEGNKADTEIPFEKKYRARFEKLVDALEKVDPAKDKDLLEVAGKYHINRLTWVTEKSAVQAIQKDLREVMHKPTTKDGKNRAFMKLFVHELVVSLKNLLARDMKTNAHVITNAALMLPVIAECKQDEVNDFLLELMKVDKDGNPVVHPFVRLCAVKGLGELNAAGGPRLDDPDNEAEQKEKRGRELKRFEALAAYIEQPYPPEGKDKAHEMAYIFARREGIKAMAKFSLPAVSVEKETVTGPIAVNLLYYANGGELKLGPKLTLLERVEAALGVCNLKNSTVPTFNGPLAVYVVGGCIADFVEGYQADYSFFKGGGTAAEKEARKGQSLLPWKNYAIQLLGGIDAMAANLSREDAAAAKNATRARQAAQAILELIGRHGLVDNPGQLHDLARDLRPQNTEVYRGIKSSEMKLQ